MDVIHPHTTPRSPPRPTYDLKCPTLLPSNRSAGEDMPIADFCDAYDLVRPIQEKLVNNGYLHSRLLRFVAIEDLKEMKFLLGEVAALRDAVDRWSQAP